MSRRRTRRNSTAMIARMPSRRTMTSNARRRSEHQEASAEQSKMRKEYSDVTLTRYTKKSFMPFLPCLLLHHLTNQVGTERTAAFVRTHWSALLLLDISGFTRLAEAACAIMAVGNYDAVDTNPTTHDPVNVKLRLHCALGCGRTNFFHIGTTRRAYSNTMLSGVSKNPYHNALHGADVMCSSAAIFSSLSETHVPSEAFSSLVIFSLGIASLLHDYKHLGVNNGFLKNFKHPLSIRFQNGAYLERMHAAEALKLIKSTSLLDTFTEQNKSAFEFLVTSLILCTLCSSVIFEGYVRA